MHQLTFNTTFFPLFCFIFIAFIGHIYEAIIFVQEYAPLNLDIFITENFERLVKIELIILQGFVVCYESSSFYKYLPYISTIMLF